jgi:hypothetical protein
MRTKGLIALAACAGRLVLTPPAQAIPLPPGGGGAPNASENP